MTSTTPTSPGLPAKKHLAHLGHVIVAVFLTALFFRLRVLDSAAQREDFESITALASVVKLPVHPLLVEPPMQRTATNEQAPPFSAPPALSPPVAPHMQGPGNDVLAPPFGAPPLPPPPVAPHHVSEPGPNVQAPRFSAPAVPPPPPVAPHVQGPGVHAPPFGAPPVPPPPVAPHVHGPATGVQAALAGGADGPKFELSFDMAVQYDVTAWLHAKEPETSRDHRAARNVIVKWLEGLGVPHEDITGLSGKGGGDRVPFVLFRTGVEPLGSAYADQANLAENPPLGLLLDEVQHLGRTAQLTVVQQVVESKLPRVAFPLSTGGRTHGSSGGSYRLSSIALTDPGHVTVTFEE